MGKKKKTRDFPKVKLKIGKKLKKTTQTDTTILSQKVVMVEQLAKSGKTVSHRGLSLDELCRQLGHYNINVRRDAIVGVKQLLTSNPHLVSSHLHLLIPSVARLICDEKADGSFRAQLKSLLELLFQTPTFIMSSHFELLLAHVLLALTHLKLFVRIFSVSIVNLLMRTYPDLCRNRRDLFDGVVGVLFSQRKPSNKKLLFDTLVCILDVFAVEEVKRSGPLLTGTFSVRLAHISKVDLTSQPGNLHFSVLGPNTLHEVSPLKTHDGILRLSSAAFPILGTMVVDDRSIYDDMCAEITTRIVQVITNIQEFDKNEEFEKKFSAIVRPYIVLVNKRRSTKLLRSAVESLKNCSMN